MNTKFLVCAIFLHLISIQLLYSKTEISNKTETLTPTTSVALPKGMHLYWSDEFNDRKLDRTKWSTNYYSTYDFINKNNYEALIADTLPQPGIMFTDSSITLITNETLPKSYYFQNEKRKVSSIQTYDWNADKLYLDNSLGGYIEVRIKRDYSGPTQTVNGAFWFDSPGVDLKYYLEEGTVAYNTVGIRPHGQPFEIDVCENLSATLVLHHDVSSEGKDEKVIDIYDIPGSYKGEWVTHGMLWTPAGLKFYINGELKKEWWNPYDIKSPNHAMNMLLGIYGSGGTSTMEIDYVRYYQWDREEGNDLPNSGFEYSDNLFPWEGKGSVVDGSVRSGKHAVKLAPNQTIYQYIYLNNSLPYKLTFYAKSNSSGNLEAEVENIKQVTGWKKHLKLTPLCQSKLTP